MRIAYTFLSICIACLLVSCTHTGKQAVYSGEAKVDSLTYAQGLTIRYFADYTAVDVRDPWDTTKLLQRYLLVERPKPLPSGRPKGTVIRVPVRKTVVYTSVHASILEQLGEAGSIVGVCEPRYMESPVIQAGLKAGRIADLGEATAPNVERMLEIGAEAIIASPFQNSSFGPVEKLGIPIIQGADYMESLPLGRTEWVKFYGLLFGKKTMADSVFRETEQAYLEVKALAADVKTRPTVVSEKKYGSSWYMPGGNSYIAHLFEDAGADYLFRDLPGAASQPLSFETVFEKAIHADYWLVKYNQVMDMTYQELRQEYAPYENFDAYQERRVYGCNTGRVPYYEEFPLHPDYLLKDLVWIFHSELLPGYTPRYYHPLVD